MTDSTTQLVSFTLDNQLIAIPLSFVERIVRAVEVTPLRKAPGTILGIIDYRGEIIAVLNIRIRLGFPERPIASTDRLMIIRTSRRRMALVADEIRDVITQNKGRTATSDMFTDTVDAEGITRCADGLILIYDPEKFLSSSEEFDLENALKVKPKKEKKND